MKANVIALSVPLFLFGIGLELWVARRRGLRLYRLADAVADMSCGVGSQVAQLFYASVLVTAYSAVHQHFTLVRFADGSLWPWVIAFFGVDFAYYWWHRASHRVN